MMKNTVTKNSILDRLRALEARPAFVAAVGSTFEQMETLQRSGAVLQELWRYVVTEHLDDAWRMAMRLGMARPAVDNACRRALAYAARAVEIVGLDGSQLRHVAWAEVLDRSEAESIARAIGAVVPRDHPDALATVFSAATALGAAIGADSWLPREEPALSLGMACIRATESAARCASPMALADAERAQQRKDLLALWPEIEGAFSAL